MTKFIFFDVADTLLYKENLESNIQKFLANQGIILSEFEIRKTQRICREIIHFPDKTTKEFYLEFNAHFLNALGVPAEEHLIDGLYQACKGLPWQAFSDTRAIGNLTLPFGVISNWDQSLKDVLAKLLPLNFAHILGSAECKIAKPNPQFFLQALSHCGFKAEEVVYVGDSIRLDILPAKKLGIRTLLIDRFDLYPNYPGERLTSLEKLHSTF